ncbi:hypothetical protein CYMTET_40550 [Cymbomonas tetramitiformis]|uniref:Helicase MOV-10-like beta-barrel domain-containing protein n=1 Tax=Cymbomonas tetramitiformis TaxID=36881 RepID=A0AAE0C9W7_9CHLO|nr:hypothetical protein CYMTET_40550 [Cymbomonas tetramitiformis]
MQGDRGASTPRPTHITSRMLKMCPELEAHPALALITQQHIKALALAPGREVARKVIDSACRDYMEGRMLPAVPPAFGPSLAASLQMHLETAGGLLGTSKPSITIPPPPTHQPPSAKMQAFPAHAGQARRGVEYRAAIQQCLNQGDVLLRDKENITLTPTYGVDFGIQRCKKQSNASASTLFLPMDGFSAAVEAKSAAPFYRQINIRNNNLFPVMLVGVHCFPDLMPSLRLHDDFGVADASLEGSNETRGGHGGALLPAGGGEYVITVDLRCIAQQQGVLSQWLVCVLNTGDRLNSDFAAVSQEAWTGGMLTIGRRICATVATAADDVAACMLRSEAAPYYPQWLRAAFATPPQMFLKGPPPLVGDLLDTVQDASWECFPRLPFCDVTRSVPAAFASRAGQAPVSIAGPTGGYLTVPRSDYEEQLLWAAGSFWQSQPQGERCYLQQLKYLLRLLSLEELAQRQSMEHYDLFHTQLVPHAAQAASPLYRLHVPGLSEQRPPVLIGDVIHVIPAGMEGAMELAGAVWDLNPRESWVAVHLPPEPGPTALREAGGRVHARFTCDATLPARMRHAVYQAAHLRTPLLPTSPAPPTPAAAQAVRLPRPLPFTSGFEGLVLANGDAVWYSLSAAPSRSPSHPGTGDGTRNRFASTFFPRDGGGGCRRRSQYDNAPELLLADRGLLLAPHTKTNTKSHGALGYELKRGGERTC